MSLGENRPLIAAIGEKFRQERVASEQCLQNQNAAVAILDVCGMNQRMQQQAYRIDKDMALLAFDLSANAVCRRFPRIVPARVYATPPFSVPLTLWLSMMAAVGLASRPIASRHFT